MTIQNGVRDVLLSSIISGVICFIGVWVSINNRVSILEVQVQGDHEVVTQYQQRTDNDMKEIKEKLEEINVKVTRLGDTKADRPFVPKATAVNEQ